MKKYLSLLLALVMCLTLLSSCNGNPGAGDTPATPSVAEGEESSAPAGTDAKTYDAITIGSVNARTVGHFDVTGLLSDNWCQPSVYLVFDQLMYVDNGVYVSDILSDFRWDDSVGEFGGIVLTLKEGVTFANGDPMTASDILYSLNRYAQVPRTAGNFSMMKLDEAQISEDGLTLTIEWTKTYGAWPLIVSTTCILDESFIEENGGADFDWTDPALANGSGPYSVASTNGDTTITFVKRNDWWQASENNGQAIVQTVTINYYTDSNTMMVDYETGAIDAVVGLTYTDYDYVVADASLGTAATSPSNIIATLVMDIDNNEALQDENLRKAICYAIDKEAVSTLAYGSLCVPAESFLSANNANFVSGYAYEYDPELAKQIIDENNLAGTELTWVVPTGLQTTMAEAIQAQLAEIGITLTLNPLDQASCIPMWLEAGSTAFLLDQTSNSNSGNLANNQWTNLRSTTDFPTLRKVDEHWNALLDNALATADEDEQAAIYAEFQEYEYNQYCCVPLCEWQGAYAFGASGVIASMHLEDVSNPNYRQITTNPVA